MFWKSWEWVDRCLPVPLRIAHPSELYRARILVLALVFSMLFAFPMAIYSYILYPDSGGFFTIVSVPFAGLSLLFLLKRYGHYQKLAFAYSLVSLFVAYFVVLRYRTIYSGYYNWIPWLIIFTCLVAGRRYALIVSLIALLQSLILLHTNSGHGAQVGMYSNFKELSWSLVLNASFAQILVILILLAFALFNARLEDELDTQHIARAHSAHKTAIGEMVGNLAHEVNNPLAIVQAAALQYRKLCDQNKLNDTSKQRLLAMMDSALNRLTHVASGLKVFASGDQSESFERILLSQIFIWVQDQNESLARTHGVKLVWRKDGLDPWLHCRPQQIVFVLSTLISNAIESCSHRRDSEVSIQVEAGPDGHFLVEVRDSGPGVSEAHVDHLFEPFFKNPSGPSLGLGLSVCLGLVNGHAGKIWYQRRNGESVFSLQLPISNPSQRMVKLG